MLSEPLPLKRRSLVLVTVVGLLAVGWAAARVIQEPEWAAELRGDLVYTRRDDNGVLRLC